MNPGVGGENRGKDERIAVKALHLAESEAPEVDETEAQDFVSGNQVFGVRTNFVAALPDVFKSIAKVLGAGAFKHIGSRAGRSPCGGSR